MIFNRVKLKNHRNNAVEGISNSLFIKHSADDIIDRLKLIDNDFSDVLEISAKCGYLTGLLKNAYQNANITEPTHLLCYLIHLNIIISY